MKNSFLLDLVVGILIGISIGAMLVLLIGCGTAEDLYCEVAPERCEDPAPAGGDDVLIKECDTRGHAKVWQKPDGRIYSIEEVGFDLCQ